MKTNKTVAIVIAMLLMLLVAAPASATYYLKVSWGQTTGIYYHLGGAWNTDNTSYVGPASALLGTAGLPNADGSPPTTPTVVESVARVFCVDVFQFDYQNWHDVAVYTGADGTTGWTTPQDTDQYRDPTGLGRAAYLANKYGFGWLTAGGGGDVWNRTVALNAAIWKASYGSLFTLNYNGGQAWENYYNNVLLPDYNTGASATSYRWFDSNQADSNDQFQDFLEPVPEPGSALLVGSILVGSALLALRRRKPPTA